MADSITVLSKRPAGGRCTLYIQYAEEIAATLRLAVKIEHPDTSVAAAHHAPGLMVRHLLIAPSDGVILSPDDVYQGLRQAGFALEEAPDLLQRLEAIQERLLEG